MPHSKTSAQIWLVLLQPELWVSSSLNPFPTNSPVPSGDAKEVGFSIMGVGQYQLLSLTNLHISRAYYNTRGFFFPHSQSSMGDPGQKESLLAMIQEPRHLLAYGFAIFNTRLPVLP